MTNLAITPAGLFMALLLGGWLGVSILWQFVYIMPFSRFGRSFRRFCRKWNAFGLVPTYAFFSTVPTFDLYLFYRDSFGGNHVTPWHQLDSDSLEWSWLWTWAWNSSRRRTRALNSFYSSILRLGSSDVWPPKQHLLTSLPYRALVQYASNLPVLPGSKLRQFVIVRSGDSSLNTGFRICFMSPFFALSRTSKKGVGVAITRSGYENNGRVSRHEDPCGHDRSFCRQE